MKQRRFGRTSDTAKVNGKVYVLAMRGGKPVYSTSTRAIEGQLSDEDRIVIDDWRDGIGRHPYTMENCLTTMRNRLQPAPKVSYLTSGLTNLTTLVRYWFEEKDASGGWYLYGVASQQVLKIELAATPVVRSADKVTGDADAFRLYGQPVKANSTAGGTKNFIPFDDQAIVTRDAWRLDTVGVGAAADTWTGVEVDASGFSHFLQLPNGKVAGISSQFSQWTFQNTCKLRILGAASNLETAANWGAEWAVGGQGYYATGMVAYDDLIIVFKQDGAYTAFQRGDNTIEFRNILQDAKSIATGTPYDIPVIRGIAWHGKLLIPAKEHLWRHNLVSAYPVGPDAEPENFGDEPGISNEIRFGSAASLEHGGEYVWMPYNLAGGAGMQMLVGREPRRGEAAESEILWMPVTSVLANKRTDSCWVTRNDTSGPRLFWQEHEAGVSRIGYMDVGADMGPFKAGASFGDVSSSGFAISREYAFPARALFREARFEIEGGDAHLSWNLAALIDGAAAVSIGSTVTATGSIFWTAESNDVARRVRWKVGWATDAGYTAAGNRTRLRKATIEFTHIPDKGDSVMFVVDVRRTAIRRRISQKAVRDELNALRDAATMAVAWVDPLGASGTIVVQNTSEEAPERAGGVLGQEIMQVQGILQEYS